MTHGRQGTILVLSEEDDVTAELVVDKLRGDGEPVVLMQTGSFPLTMGLTAEYRGSKWAAELELADGARVDLDSVRSIWNRRPGSFTFQNGLSPESLAFVKAEAKQALTGALHSSRCQWINPPQQESIARYKPLQLRIAQQIGLEIPDTLITSSPEAARRFWDAHDGNVIYKRLSSASLYDERGGLTQPLTTLVSEEMAARLDQVSVTPCLFQEFVPKAYELRVTIVDDLIVAARIDSQASERTRVDWRPGAGEMLWTEHELPVAIRLALRRLMGALGLVFGAIDIVVTPAGRYVFLEVNPSGQWAWFPEPITNRIRDRLAAVLAAGVVASEVGGEAPVVAGSDSIARSSAL